MIMDPKLTESERLLLNTIQDGFPVEARPYSALAARLSSEHGLALSEDEVIESIRSLKGRGYIRRLGAVFNSRPLGYMSTLCAARVPEDRVDSFGKLVSSFPQVTHNYVRSNPLNVWFTFCYALPEELVSFLSCLRKETGIDEIFELTSKQIFKIRAVFSLSR
ncbi:MAG: Lrp/AsnC family transcriptional regulator [Deltaproteobacteria bacterium]|jgi:DNA-binding Lrp family transcriptional regulator|nr:Lrp/AsnC family transcriptional regulator [Deltaproteobacteria bacterium]